MWGYDQIAGLFNTLVSKGLISHVGVESQTVLYWSIVLYGPINLLCWSLHCILVGNARTEYNSGFITSNPTGNFLLFAIIVAATMLNFGTCVILDPLTISISGQSSSALISLGVADEFAVIFNAAHVLSALAVGIAYLYMMFLTISVETLQWGQPTV